MMSTISIADDLLDAAKISEAGVTIQSKRLKVISENLANEDSTASSPKKEPYKRKIMFVKNKYNKSKGVNLVEAYKYSRDSKTPFKVKYDPGHPAADLEGLVKYPNVNKIIEKADAQEAQRSYEANISMIEMSRELTQRTLDILK